MSFDDRPAGIALSNVLTGGFDLVGVETLSGYIFQPAAPCLDQQDGGSIHIQLFDHLIDQDRQRDLQIENAANGKIDRPKRGQSLQLFDRLFMQVHTVDGISTDLCQRI